MAMTAMQRAIAARSARRKMGTCVRRVRLRASQEEATRSNSEMSDPCDNAFDEIRRGVAVFKENKVENADVAIGIFKRCLELEGSGVRRDRGKPASLSPGELQAVYYNTACALTAKGDADGALLALASALENGFDDYETLRRDPDLIALRSDSRLEQLLSRFDKGWIGRLFSGTRSYFS